MRVETAKKPSSVSAMPVIEAAALLRMRAPIVIDLRSPVEFAEDHFPGARNVPLFDDVGRVLVGTIYGQVSPAAAYEVARALVLQRARALIAEIGVIAAWSASDVDLEARVTAMMSGGYEHLSSMLLSATPIAHAEEPIVLHCWRGGLRSRSVLALVRTLGLDRATLLVGGYKSYRAEVAAAIERLAWPKMFVLSGWTGVGKTLVLRELEHIRPNWTLDLEGLAGHRGSLLGMVGLEPRSQKRFESLLLERARAGFPRFVVVEGESRKVGDIILPKGLWQAMTAATHVEMTASRERRVDVLCADYLATNASRAQLAHQLTRLETLMTRKHDAPSLVSMLASGAERELVELLLERHYDPLYRHAEKGKQYACRVDAEDPTRAAIEIANWIEAR